MPPTTKRKITSAEARKITAIYRMIPDVYVRDMFMCLPWDLQNQIIRAVFDNPIVGVASCNAAGKSWLAARVALAFLELIENSLVVTTAPTWRQVKDVLWRELGTAYATSRLRFGRFDPTQVGLEISKQWYAVGLSTKDREKFFGYHADNILVIVDEASGVEEPIFEGVDAVTPNKNAHVLFIGNPTSLSGRFRQTFDNPLAVTFHISAFDTPNFTANNIKNLDDLIKLYTPPADADPIAHMKKVNDSLIDLPDYRALISPGRVYQRYLEWGTDSPMWQALIMGEFPNQAENTLIPLNLVLKSAEVRKQMDDPLYAKEVEWHIPKSKKTEIGIDVARFGSDRTVLAPRQGGYVRDLVSWAKLDTVETSTRVFQFINPEDHLTALRVDDTGVGGGVTDQLYEMLNRSVNNRFTVEGINFGSASTDPSKFYNLRAEMYWNLREQFMNHSIAIPDDPELINELTSVRYEYTGKSQIKIEAKDEIKKRSGKSPDRADALALAMYSQSFDTWGDAVEQQANTPRAAQPQFSAPVQSSGFGGSDDAMMPAEKMF